MRTNQAIYFGLLIVGVLTWLKFGAYPILAIVIALASLCLWLWLRYPHAWQANGFIVRVLNNFREEHWVEYQEAGRTLTLRSIWAATKNGGLNVEIDERVYFPPDYSHPLSQERIDEIEKRVSEGLHHLGIQHCFVRTGKPNA